MNPLNPRNFTLAMLAVLVMSISAMADHNTQEALEARTAPEGRLNVVAAGEVAGGGGSTAGGPQSGAEVYATTCATCHNAGIAGAPKTGDVDAWKTRIAAGMATLVAHAIDGFQGETGIMIAKGGNAALSDAEVEAAVEYMVEQSQ